MTMSVALVPEGHHHAVALGPITQGAGFGEVAALGVGQLLRLRLPFGSTPQTANTIVMVGFEEQFYVLSKSLDGNVTDVRLNATQFEYDAQGAIIRLDVDIAAFPAEMQIWLEAHHSIGR
jgi:hypothetical protein